MSSTVGVGSVSFVERRIQGWMEGLFRHWLLILNVLLGIWVVLPWLAPVFMHVGWERAGQIIYLIYRPFCHQLPERSWFLFGSSFTHSLAEIDQVSGAGTDMWALRLFLGTPELGWKLAWSDRMVSFYGGWFLFGLLYAVLRRRTSGIRWRAALLLMLPMLLDGVTHMISDFWGIGGGFRDTNGWLALLTGHLLPGAFYSGDAWGSLNSLARLVTGLLAAFAMIFWLLPIVDRALDRTAAQSQQMPPVRA